MRTGPITSQGSTPGGDHEPWSPADGDVLVSGTGAAPVTVTICRDAGGKVVSS